VANGDFYEASYGGVRLWISQIQTDEGRSLIEHTPATGDEFALQDRGANNKIANVSLIFEAKMRGDKLTAIERLNLLRAEIDDKPRMFRHPILGSYLARAGNFKHSAAAGISITGEMTIYPETNADTLPQGESFGIFGSGVGSIAASAPAAKTALDQVGFDSSIIDETEKTVESWTNGETVNTKQITEQSDSLKSRLREVASSLENDIELWESYTAVVQLIDDLSSTGDELTASSAASFAMRLGEPVAARALLASVYGADEAESKYDSFLAMNDVDNPLMLGANIPYLMPPKSPKERSA
jgi:hypothetical protein